MEAFASAGPDPPPSAKRKPRPGCLKFERWVCNVVKYFPLAFVYGLTTWAVWVEARVGLQYTRNSLFGKPVGTLGIFFYLLLNASYTVAVFTDPGSPLSTSNRRGGNRHEYSHLPTTEPPQPSSLTVNSSGGSRYCKKCQAPKPDRAHHCSTCKRCVLKMDHHCPWLATCVGQFNYKPFLLFLIYTCVFCWICLLVSARWVWSEMLTNITDMERALPINVVLLAVISAVIGLVLTGFTGWHVSLAVRGLTTIECLEKTRYLSPIRKTLDRHRSGAPNGHPPGYNVQNHGGFRHTLQGYGQQFVDMHANAIPGVTRAEEGEERPSPTLEDHGYDPDEHQNNYNTPAQQSLYHSYEELERARDRDRYQEYLDERDGEKLPNAFDLGWRRNLTHLFGPNRWLWLLPVCNTTGDGWHWEASAKWVEVKQRIDQQRVERWEEEQRHQQDLASRYPQRERQPYYGHEGGYARGAGPRNISHPGRSYQDTDERPLTGVSMKTLAPMSPRPRPGETDFDAEDPSHGGNRGMSRDILTESGRGGDDEWRDWDEEE